MSAHNLQHVAAVDGLKLRIKARGGISRSVIYFRSHRGHLKPLGQEHRQLFVRRKLLDIQNVAASRRSGAEQQVIGRKCTNDHGVNLLAGS